MYPPPSENQSIFTALSQDSNAGYLCASRPSEYRKRSNLVEIHEQQKHDTDTSVPYICTQCNSLGKTQQYCITVRHTRAECTESEQRSSQTKRRRYHNQSTFASWSLLRRCHSLRGRRNAAVSPASSADPPRARGTRPLARSVGCITVLSFSQCVFMYSSLVHCSGSRSPLIPDILICISII